MNLNLDLNLPVLTDNHKSALQSQESRLLTLLTLFWKNIWERQTCSVKIKEHMFLGYV